MTSVWSGHEASPWPTSVELETPGPTFGQESPFLAAGTASEHLAPAGNGPPAAHLVLAHESESVSGQGDAALPVLTLAYESTDQAWEWDSEAAGGGTSGQDFWVPGAERVRNSKSSGGRYLDSPWRFVFHTIEGEPSADGFRRLAARHGNPPHLWAMPSADLLLQTIPLNRSAYALARPGSIQTNRLHAVQVELWGFAAKMGSATPETIAWLADRLLTPVARLIPLNLDRVSPIGSGEACYGTTSRCRMSAPEWRAFDGVTGHNRVPDNKHWDPGKLDLPAIAARAKASLGNQPQVSPEFFSGSIGIATEQLGDHDGPGFASESEDNESPDQWTGDAELFEAAPSFEWQETDAWLPALPGSYVGSASEIAALQAAVRSGQRSEILLANLIFFRRHPERNQRPLSATEPDFARLSQEWLHIRDTLVRPLLGGSTPPATTPPTTTAPPTGIPSGPAPPVSGGSAIRWATNANSAAVPAYAQRVLTDIVRAAGLTQILVSSTQRSPADQARVMFNNCRQFGPQSQLDLYGSVGDRVLKVYIDSTAAGRTDAQIMADMERKIIELGPPNVSRHTADPNVLAVIDIAPSSVTDKAAFERAVKADSRVSLFLQPPLDPAYHVEIPIAR